MKKLRLPATLCVLVFLLLPGGIPLPSAAAAVPRQQVIMVLVNRLGYEDLRDAQLPGIRQLAQRGACGLMIVKTAGVPRDPSAYLTLGAGTPAAAPQAAGRNFNAAEEPEPAVSARDVYFRNTGFQAPPEAVVQIAPGVLLESNARLDHPVLPGALGECIRRAGKKTAVIGTSDNKMEQAERWAPLVAMDGRGLVDAGDVGNDLLLADPLAPFGSRTDYARLERRLAALRDRADLIVVETGDLYRLAMVEGEMLSAQAAAARRQALRRVDAFVGRLLPWIDRHTLIMLVSPLPPPAALKSGARFTP
ncbi:MAG: hypothetical protein AB1776_08945 [Bacillota bacterium]